ncbi:DUF1302 domain-containing protein [Opitutus terrae]|uniref:DUF1302 domain-containing protein n=1 Tax=Opitutus terrae (strain DSM 11246 / JCM 15787 / PB90-1) TaxID=452637 RepID=B1ZMZ5_OPITP|nr:DUF1302 domain-containing protein [Opitutus terrae]ACB76447.1 protein of unknown function DUF1302 [Opitutus terrae PB90-1]
MNDRPDRVVPRLAHLIALAIAAATLLSPSVSALQFTSGKLTGSFDSTFSVGGLYRLNDPDPMFYGITNSFNGVRGQQNSVNADDGNLNYGQGWASFLAKGSHDLELRYENFGAFIRGYYFTDGKTDKTLRTPLSGDARERVEQGAELLDAYVVAKFTLFTDTPVDVRLGRQVLSLGESTFIPNGINVVNPVDLSKLRAPGSELKEAFLPVNMLKASIGVTENLTIEPFWLLEFRRNELEPAGTLFSTNDIAGRGGNKVLLGFGGLPDSGTTGAIPRTDDRRPQDIHQYGVAVRTMVPALNDTEFGFYFANYRSRSPVISARTPTRGISSAFVVSTASGLAQQQLAPAMVAAGYPAAGVPSALTTLIGAALTNVPGAALPATLRPFYPAAQTIAAGAGKLGLLDAAATARYFIEYPDEISMLGASFNTSVGNTGISWQGEVSFKNDVPLQVDDVELLFAALSVLNPLFAPPNNQMGNFLGQYNREIPGYRRHKVWTAQTTVTKVFGPMLGAQQLSLVAEVGGVQVNLPSKTTLRYDGPGTFTSGDWLAMARTGNTQYGYTPGKAFADKFSWGYQVFARLDYTNLFAGVNMSPAIGFTHDVRGNTPLPLGNFIEDRKSVNLSAEFTYQNRWAFELRYVNYFDGGRYNLLQDRDFVATTLKYSF